MWVIILILIILLLIFDISNKQIHENYTPIIYPKIDIVYTWVEYTKDFEIEKNYWLQKEGKSSQDLSGESLRYIDNEEIKYSIRSIEKFFPYYNKIYIVVKDGQFPKYLKTDHPRLIFINHSEIIPQEYLPTFNSMAIEAYLHRIPNLSEYYLYFNDDIMLLKNLDPSYFINSEGIPYSLHDNVKSRSYLKPDEIDYDDYDFNTGWQVNYLLLDKIAYREHSGRYFMSHIPKIYKTSYDYEIENKLSNIYLTHDTNIYEATGMSKFRKNSNLYLVSVLKENLYVYWFRGIFKETKHSTFYYFKDNEKIDPEAYFLCIEQIQSKNFHKYLELMKILYPDKSDFEL